MTAPTQRVLVTGADGFVGRRVCRRFVAAGWAVRGTRRSGPCELSGEVEYRSTGDIAALPDWRPIVEGATVVVHTAGRAHDRAKGAGERVLESCRRVNVEAAVHLAQSAAASGVRRFVHIGSLLAEEVHGGTSSRRRPYAVSKREAEEALAGVAAGTGMEIVILRPPLVYGPGVAANFALLLKAVRNRWPLPLASVDNRRSFIFVDNLADAIATAAGHPGPLAGTFAVSDGESLSVAELVRRLAHAMGREPRLLPCPPAMLRVLGAVAGQGERVESLCASLIADDRPFREATGWSPPFTLDEGLSATVRGVPMLRPATGRAIFFS